MRWCCAPLATAARGWALLPLGGSPCGLAVSPPVATWFVGLPTGAVTASDRHCGWCGAVGGCPYALTHSFALLWRRCPCTSGGATHCGRQPPCQGAATPAADAAVGSPLWVRCWQPLAGWPRPRVAAPCGLLPLRVATPCRWPAAPCRGALAAIGRPCRGVGRG
ncbi:hypothetical protein BHM03_00061643 [Ensete ventricosum]|nr:hypothetical protein BHM03_00061643 [Ensete ventricosum]